MTKTEIAVIFFIVFTIVLWIVSIFLRLMNPKLYCDIAMMGSIEDEPAYCLKEITNPLQRVELEVTNE